MTIQDILDKVSEAGVPLWDMKSYGFVIRDSSGIVYKVIDIKIDEEKQLIKIKTEKTK